MSVTITSATSHVSSQFQLSCRHVNTVSRTDAPAKWELRSFIRFLQVEGNITAEICRRMSRVYCERFMSDDIVREWCRKFKAGRTDVIDEEGHGRKSVATDDIAQRVPGSFWSS
ncbi:hypothetical protein AVEN_100733-1 [Araneus ventricosus]|uniref:Mos1 transposase HTH domain-containing protein n=1 Tax=Araneus ventricosus TaxID=182803 RepID=A0A4Y2CUQ9_ARAVE|nr:hypothetical protein AVEN_100733-1 [Araneus ventricosus]